MTGAGGSIGSELVRQITAFRPRLIVLFELSEFALYLLEQEFLERYPDGPDLVRHRRCQRMLRH